MGSGLGEYERGALILSEEEEQGSGRSFRR